MIAFPEEAACPVVQSACTEVKEPCSQIYSEFQGIVVDGSCKHSQIHKVCVSLSSADCSAAMYIVSIKNIIRLVNQFIILNKIIQLH